MSDSLLPRHLLEKYFGADPRLVAAFEDQAQAVTDNGQAAAVAVGATEALQDATVIVLSANGAFTNERILDLGDGIDIDITPTTVKLSVKERVKTQDFAVLLVPTADSTLDVPPSGTVITSEVVTVLGNFANDAGAAGGGAPVGGLYRNGSVLMVRVV